MRFSTGFRSQLADIEKRCEKQNTQSDATAAYSNSLPYFHPTTPAATTTRAASISITDKIRQALLVITSGFLYFRLTRMMTLTAETNAIRDIDTTGTESVDMDARTTAPLTRRMAEVVSCEARSQRL